MEKPEAIVKDIENYLTAQKIDKVVKEMVVSTLHNKPENVPLHMVKHLITKAKDMDGDGVAVATSEDGVATVAFTHSEAAGQQFLVGKGVPQLFAELLQRIAQERPDDVGGFIIEHLSR
ncbi:hypothetical protein HYH03_015715 [Edaphochlamys debaryana]|uniref:Uncharacterized protein n=1 Tax=Edaphochlamys debaryana TaxID=47281 RepID=A0A836BQY9_9CHLO|nr:hypothetical protein HYH03_015715 [Edaphochlamys debaryana]|eukprot:KAG2485547.1 hypothetical protein HYH03_015715 [Edaphochlamys debaryana]